MAHSCAAGQRRSVGQGHWSGLVWVQHQKRRPGVGRAGCYLFTRGADLGAARTHPLRSHLPILGSSIHGPPQT